MSSAFGSLTCQTLLSQCIAEGALADAWARVHANAGCPGVDGMSVATYHQNALSHLSALRQDILAGRYRPQALLGVAIPKDSGRMRQLAIPTVRDRVFQTSVAQLLARLLDPDFDDASFAYRCGRSVRQATARIVECRDRGLRWVVDADIRDYFDSIHHPTLLSMLRKRLPDDSLTALLAQWLAAPVQQDGELRPRRRGVPQGSPISPLLANLYLNTLDHALTTAGHALVRYADDFLVLCRSRVEAEAAFAVTREHLDKLRLEINEEKSRITHFQAGFRFLGVRFEGERVIPVDPETASWVLPAGPQPPTVVPVSLAGGSTAHPAPAAPDSDYDVRPPTDDDALELADPDAVRLDDESDGQDLPRSVYVTTQGVHLSRQRERLLVSRGKEVIARVPLRLLDQIVVQGNAMISTAIIRHCGEQHLGLAFADIHGNSPVLLDTAADADIGLLAAQVRRHDDAAFGLDMARACIRGKLHNCAAVLRRYLRRNTPDRVTRALAVLEHCQRGVDHATDLDVLRGYEGRAARAYFIAVRALIPEIWGFRGRNRQPPRDPVNAMLSYGYSVLSNVMRTAVGLAHLHAGFGHLHAAAPGRPALVCDLMEEFRPLAVDSVILTLTRKHTLNPTEDFVTPAESGACCRLQSAARHLLIARLEARLATPLACAEGSGRSNLHRMLRVQVARYARALAGGSPYRPYLAP